MDLDVGVMADMRKLRIGVTSKNLRSPTFGRQLQELPWASQDARDWASPCCRPLASPLLWTSTWTRSTSRAAFVEWLLLAARAVLGARAAVRGGVRWSREATGAPVGAVGWQREDPFEACGSTGTTRKAGRTKIASSASRCAPVLSARGRSGPGRSRPPGRCQQRAVCDWSSWPSDSANYCCAKSASRLSNCRRR